MTQIGHLMRYKKTIPFSQRLNDFIEKRVESIPYIIDNSTAEYSFEKVKELYEKTGKVHTNNLNCENNIYGNKDINVKFRVWHDYLHIKYNLGFTLEDETKVYGFHTSELPKDWRFEKDLLFAEVVQQVKYFTENNEFPVNQREFVINELRKLK